MNDGSAAMVRPVTLLLTGAMLEFLMTASLFAAVLTTGLMAGLFYAYSISVMPGLARTDDRTYVGAMQKINVAILNGWFAVGFGGAFAFTGFAGVLHLAAGERVALPWIAAGLVLYTAVLAITFRVNVPLNNALVAVGAPGSADDLADERADDLASLRHRFETTWVRWNAVRTLGSTAAFASLVVGLLVRGAG